MFTTIVNFSDALDTFCQPKPLALKQAPAKKKKATKKNEKNKTPANAKGAKANANGAKQGADEASKKRKLSIDEAEAEMVKDFEEEQMLRKRVHSKGYHAALKHAKLMGTDIEEAKACARKAGADAIRVWAENGKK